MENKEFLKVVQAYDEGKEVQQKVRGFEEWKPFDGKWNTVTYTYRIKPEEEKPKYRPYQSVEEVWEDERVHGKEGFVKRQKGKEHYEKIFQYSDFKIWSGIDECRTYEEAFNELVWPDGTPFGKRIGDGEL